MTWTGPGSHHTPRHVAPGSTGIEEQPQGEQVVAVWARGRRCLQMGVVRVWRASWACPTVRTGVRRTDWDQPLPF